MVCSYWKRRRCGLQWRSETEGGISGWSFSLSLVFMERRCAGLVMVVVVVVVVVVMKDGDTRGWWLREISGRRDKQVVKSSDNGNSTVQCEVRV
jgi:hypothetical protein